MADTNFDAALDLGLRSGSLEHNMNKDEKLADLRHFLRAMACPLTARQSLWGCRWRRSSRRRPQTRQPARSVCGDWGAGGFAACLAIRARGRKPLFWIRPDYAAMEYGALSAAGFLELGGDPEKSASAARAPMRKTRCRPPPIFSPARIWARWCWKWRARPNALILWRAAGSRYWRRKAASPFSVCAKAPSPAQRRHDALGDQE